MSYTLDIEKADEIRCPHCLSWNNKKSTICGECTTALFDSNNFGAARALFSWENTSSSQLKYVFSSEKKDKIDHWNTIFQIQFEFFQKEFPYYNFLSKYSILDIQDEVCKYFLSRLPMRPEVFKEYKEYDFPKNNKNEIELLNFTFRTHPSSVFKALAGLALIQTGRADLKIVQYLNEWEGHYKKLRQEKLLSFAHWSVQKMNYVKHYSPYINEVMPLANQGDNAASWTKIYLYKADYDIQELKFELEDIIQSEKVQVAISACFALRKYDKIKDLLLNELDESTIDLVSVYSDERHIPNMLLFLKHAPRKYHESIIRRCVQLKPKDAGIKEQVVDWLLNQDDAVLLEVLFSWEEIPQFDTVLSKLLNDAEGIQALLSFLPQWMTTNERSLSDNKDLRLIFEKDKNSLDAKTQALLLNLQDKIRDIDFEMLCADVRKKSTSESVKKLFAQLFVQKHVLRDRQVIDGFYGLARFTENTKVTEVPYFVFKLQWGLGVELSEKDFHAQLLNYLMNEESKTPASNWLFAVYEMLAASKSNQVVDADVFDKHTAFVLNAIADKRLDAGTSCRFLKLLCKLKTDYTLSDLKLHQLTGLVSESNDFEMKYWVDQLTGK